METPEGNGSHRRPELERENPAKLFPYAQSKERWYRERVSASQLPDAMEHLKDELNAYIVDAFETMPNVRATSRDVIATTSIIEPKPGSYLIEARQPEFEGDDKFLGEYTVEGTLYGFHCGVDSTLRVYVTSDNSSKTLQGGVYIPLVSLGVGSSELQLTAYPSQERIDEIGERVAEQLGEYSSEVHETVATLLDTLNMHTIPVASRLQKSSPMVIELLRYGGVKQGVIDDLFDIIKLKLSLDVPQEIEVSGHRLVPLRRYVTSYDPGGSARFSGIVPDLGIIGETANPTVGLLFLHNNHTVQIPVQSLTSIKATKI